MFGGNNDSRELDVICQGLGQIKLNPNLKKKKISK